MADGLWGDDRRSMSKKTHVNGLFDLLSFFLVSTQIETFAEKINLKVSIKDLLDFLTKGFARQTVDVEVER